MKKEIKKFVKANSNFEHNGGLNFSTRENGNVGDETYGDEDLQKAYELKKSLLDNFEGITVEVETCDEWVYIYVRKIMPDKYRYGFKKEDDKGRGFSSTFDSMEELISEYGFFVNVDWVEIIKIVEQINEFPENTFLGFHRSKKLLIKEANHEDNNYKNYNFYIIKLKKDKD